MDLQDCTIGTLVALLNKDGELERVGVVKGITNNCKSADYHTRSNPLRAIPSIQWSGESEESSIHHGNLTKFKEKMLRNIA